MSAINPVAIDQRSADRRKWSWLDQAPVLAQRYQVAKANGVIGRGAYSRLVAATDLQSQRAVAVKIMENDGDLTQAGEQEADLIRSLNSLDAMDSCHIVKVYDRLRISNHCCMVMERLHSSVNDVLRARPRSSPGLSLDIIRKIAVQLITALQFLGQQQIVHADLKPENILFITPWSETCAARIKVIDFGNAFTLKNAHAYYDDWEIQTLPYRAPEIACRVEALLASDMWSVGCIVAEMFTGKMLFAGNDANVLLHSVTQLMGPLPQDYFGRCTQLASTLRPAVPLIAAKRQRRLAAIMGISTHDELAMELASFVATLLDLDPRQRATPALALQHPFLCRLFPFTLFNVHAQVTITATVSSGGSRQHAVTVAQPGASPGNKRKHSMRERDDEHDIVLQRPAKVSAVQVKAEGDIVSSASQEHESTTSGPTSPVAAANDYDLTDSHWHLQQQQQLLQRQAAEIAARAARERAEQEEVERRHQQLEQERLEQERQERERLELQRIERERQAQLKLEAERLEQERLRLIAEAEKRERERLERLEREKAERERQELLLRELREKAEREKAEREKAEREKAEREKAAREKAERERIERDKAAKAERERVERAAKELAKRLEQERKAKAAKEAASLELEAKKREIARQTELKRVEQEETLRRQQEQKRAREALRQMPDSVAVIKSVLPAVFNSDDDANEQDECETILLSPVRTPRKARSPSGTPRKR